MWVAVLAEGTSVAPMAEEVATLLTGPEIDADLVKLDVEPRIVVTPYSLLTIRGRLLSPAAERMKEIVRNLLTEGAEHMPNRS